MRPQVLQLSILPLKGSTAYLPVDMLHADQKSGHAWDCTWCTDDLLPYCNADRKGFHGFHLLHHRPELFVFSVHLRKELFLPPLQDAQDATHAAA